MKKSLKNILFCSVVVASALVPVKISLAHAQSQVVTSSVPEGVIFDGNDAPSFMPDYS